MQRIMGVSKEQSTSYLILATDDILYMSKHEKPLKELLNKFGDFFSFKGKKEYNCNSLNLG